MERLRRYWPCKDGPNGLRNKIVFNKERAPVLIFDMNISAQCICMWHLSDNCLHSNRRYSPALELPASGHVCASAGNFFAHRSRLAVGLSERIPPDVWRSRPGRITNRAGGHTVKASVRREKTTRL